jgi:hypothetical protein
VKEFFDTLLRVLLILSAGMLGLVGLLVSTCGGLAAFSGPGTGGAFGFIAAGLACIAVAAGLILWISRASRRAVLILFLLLWLPLLPWLLFRSLRH